MLDFDWISLVLGLLAVATSIWMAIRFERSESENIHYVYTVLLALGAGFLAAFIPGLLSVGGDFKGLTIRAAGGFGVFVVVLVIFYLLRTKKVIASLRAR